MVFVRIIFANAITNIVKHVECFYEKFKD